SAGWWVNRVAISTADSSVAKLTPTANRRPACRTGWRSQPPLDEIGELARRVDDAVAVVLVALIVRAHRDPQHVEQHAGPLDIHSGALLVVYDLRKKLQG